MSPFSGATDRTFGDVCPGSQSITIRTGFRSVSLSLFTWLCRTVDYGHFSEFGTLVRVGESMLPLS